MSRRAAAAVGSHPALRLGSPRRPAQHPLFSVSAAHLCRALSPGCELPVARTPSGEGIGLLLLLFLNFENTFEARILRLDSLGLLLTTFSI